MDNRDQAIPVVPDVKEHVSIHVIGIMKLPPYPREIMPPGRRDNHHPRRYFLCRIWVMCRRLAQMLSCDNMHRSNILHNM